MEYVTIKIPKEYIEPAISSIAFNLENNLEDIISDFYDEECKESDNDLEWDELDELNKNYFRAMFYKVLFEDDHFMWIKDLIIIN